MPRFISFSNARFVGPGDFLPDERKLVVIDKVFEETFRNEPVPKIVITVIANNGWQRDLTINQTNGRVLADHYGDEMDDWVDKSVELYIVDTEYNKEPRKGVRIMPVTPSQPALPPPPPPAKDELDDDIPF